jgi:hypothetical protein
MPVKCAAGGSHNRRRTSKQGSKYAVLSSSAGEPSCTVLGAASRWSMPVNCAAGAFNVSAKRQTEHYNDWRRCLFEFSTQSSTVRSTHQVTAASRTRSLLFKLFESCSSPSCSTTESGHHCRLEYIRLH